MREGVDRGGRHLYPAFPYDHFTMLSDEELHALYAFLMTREPVRAETPANDVVFPFNVRMLIAAWKMLYLDRGPFRSDSAQGSDWTRGAYLVQGLAHCGACHTPRNVLGAERKREFLAGGTAEGWRVPAINSASRTPVPWTAESLFRYLRHGAAETSEVAAGPMANVVHNFAAAREQDVRAIAIYVASLAGAPDADRAQRAEQALARARAGTGAADYEAQKGAPRTNADAAIQAGGVVYGATCALCHSAAKREPGAPSSGALHLALSTSIALPEPGNLIRIILQGMAPPDGDAGFFMPGFAAELADEQIAAVVTYLRAAYTDRPAWPNVEREVRRTRGRLAEGK
jgi:mono/diheme cytochrome c family protein